MKVVPIDSWYDCGNPETLLATNRYLLQKQGSFLEKHKNYNLQDSVIIPPVFIADTVEITLSVIGPFVSIANGSKVKKSIIQDTIINENAQVENMLLNQSLIGDSAIVNGRFSRLNVGDSSKIELL